MHDTKTLVEKLHSIQSVLVAHATGKEAQDSDYIKLRQELIDNPEIGDRLPIFVKTCRSLGQFWGYICNRSGGIKKVLLRNYYH